MGQERRLLSRAFLAITALYLIINLILLEKYAVRHGAAVAVVAGIVYPLVVFGGMWLFGRFGSRIGCKTLVVSTVLSALLLCLMQMSIDPSAIKVDRWSAIDGFLRNLLSGVSPYSAHTHLDGRGSPFPVWQLFHLPFYAVGNVGLSFLAGLALFVHSVYKLLGAQRAFGAMCLVVLSPSFVYEVAVRSDLYTNFLVVCSAVIYMRLARVSIEKNMLLVAVVCSLLVCTRISTAIPLAMFLLPQYVSSPVRQKFLFPLFCLFFCVAVFLPFVLWDYSSLSNDSIGPVALQFNKASHVDYVLIAVLAIWQAFTWKDDFDKYFFRAGVTMFVVVALSFLHKAQTDGFWNFYAPAYDVTYFHQALPFVIVSISVSALGASRGKA